MPEYSRITVWGIKEALTESSKVEPILIRWAGSACSEAVIITEDI